MKLFLGLNSYQLKIPKIDHCEIGQKLYKNTYLNFKILLVQTRVTHSFNNIMSVEHVYMPVQKVWIFPRTWFTIIQKRNCWASPFWEGASLLEQRLNFKERFDWFVEIGESIWVTYRILLA